MAGSVRWLSAGLFAATAVLFLSGCSATKSDTTNSETAAIMAEARAVTPADVERYANKMTDAEYPVYLDLMGKSGLTGALGGPDKAEAALQGLMGQFKRSAIGFRDDIPKLVKIGGPAEAHSYGLVGIATSFGDGFAVAIEAEGATSGSKTASKDGMTATIENTVTDGNVATTVEREGDFGNLTGKVSTKIVFDKCSDAQGRMHVKFSSTTSLRKKGGTIGANVKIEAEGTIYFDDDANAKDDADFDIHVEHAVFDGRSSGSYIDASFVSSSTNPSASKTTVNRASSQATQKDFQVLTAEANFARFAALATQFQGSTGMKTGKCVTLNPTSTPSKRSGVKPSTAFEVFAAPRSKLDGTPTGGTVKATLSGGSSLDPADTKVKADAKFAYVAPGEKNKKASIAFEARSKRGIGKATLDFDTNNMAYSAVGGGGGFQGSGTICSLGAPFTISGMGVTNTFTPSGDKGGTYKYAGSMSGFSVFGSGTYTVEADDTGGKLTATGPGSVKTPMGVKTSTGTEVYKLTPTEPCG